jgi:hypothetical protein
MVPGAGGSHTLRPSRVELKYHLLLIEERQAEKIQGVGYLLRIGTVILSH